MCRIVFNHPFKRDLLFRSVPDSNPFNPMNYIDIIIIVVIGLFVARGVQKGLVNTLTGVVSFITALFVATGMVGNFAQAVQSALGTNKGISYILAYVTLFFSVLLLFRLIAHIILKFFEITSTRWIDRIGGGVFGFLISSLLVSVIFLALSFFTFTERLMPERDNSFLYPYARDFYPVVYDLFVRIGPTAQSFQDITAEFLRDQPQEALRKTEAGRAFLEYLEKIKQAP
ncbi:CvpA family protein [candidate division KSB1 bacterium]